MLSKQSLLAYLRKPNMLRVLLMDTLENMRSVWHRTLLALLGIVIGTTAVTALLSIGNNTADESIRQFKAMGTDLIVVQNGLGIIEGERGGKALSIDDAVNLVRDIPGITEATPISIGSAKVGQGPNLLDATFVGASAGLLSAARFELEAGRFISNTDGYETLAVVGSNIAQSIMPDMPERALGRKIRIDNYLYTIVGILKKAPRNQLLPFDVNQTLIVPYKSSRRMEFNTGVVSNIIIRVADHRDPIIALGDISFYFSAHEKIVQVQGAMQLIQGMKKQNQLFTWMLTGVAAISLLVGGIGIMNTMLASIIERRKEIGLRMAIGANRASILITIIFESVVLSLLGGFLGTLFGISIAIGYSVLLGQTYSVPLFAVFLGLGMSLITGLFFGIYPALKAARLSPIEALR